MRARQGAAYLFVVPALALALGAAGCGGSGAATTTDTAQARLAETHWRAGLIRWRRDMLHALDGISVLFSTTASLSDLNARHSRDSIVLARDEATLVGCTTRVERLGPVPRPFRVSHKYALLACQKLEEGEQLVETAVVRLRKSAPPTDPLSSGADPLDQASEPLGTGRPSSG